MTLKEVVTQIKKHANPENVERMARFGITAKKAYGVSTPVLRKIAKDIGKNHELAQELWKTEIYEARKIACMIEDPRKVTEKQMDKWVNDFDSWGICDTCCGDLFDKTDIVYKKVNQWVKSKKEFVRRAGFATIAWFAVHDKKTSDGDLEKFFTLIKKYSTDERNFVKKAVNWALRQIGKRNLKLNREAVKVAKEIKEMDSKSAKWIANDAIRELTSKEVKKRLKR